eukprot:UN03657
MLLLTFGGSLSSQHSKDSASQPSYIVSRASSSIPACTHAHLAFDVGVSLNNLGNPGISRFTPPQKIKIKINTKLKFALLVIA